MSPGSRPAPTTGRSRVSLAEIHELSAVQLRDALRSGSCLAGEATGHFLDRIEAENPHLGAFITVTAEQALKDAAAADRLHARAAPGRDATCRCCTGCRWPSRT